MSESGDLLFLFDECALLRLVSFPPTTWDTRPLA